MSLFSKVFKAGKKLIGKIAPLAGVIPGPVGAIGKAVGMIGTAGAVGGAMAGAGRAVIPAVGRTLPGIGKIGGAIVRSPVARGVAAGAAGSAIYDAAGNYLGQRRRSRRINPLNHKALKRAMTRIEKSKQLVKRLNSITIRKEKC